MGEEYKGRGEDKEEEEEEKEKEAFGHLKQKRS